MVFQEQAGSLIRVSKVVNDGAGESITGIQQSIYLQPDPGDHAANEQTEEQTDRERERETDNRLDIFIPTGVMSHSGNHPGLWGLSHPPVDDVLECDL